MKLTISILCLAATSLFAASPSFSQFDTNSFTVVDGVSVAAKPLGQLTNNTIFVSSVLGNDANPGTMAAPVATVSNANAKAVFGTTVKVAGGNYLLTAPIGKDGTTWLLEANCIIGATNGCAPVFYLSAGEMFIAGGTIQGSNSVLEATSTGYINMSGTFLSPGQESNLDNLKGIWRE